MGSSTEETKEAIDEGKRERKQNEFLKSIKKKGSRQVDNFEQEYLRLKEKQVKGLHEENMQIMKKNV